MWQLERVARADVHGGDGVLGQLKLHKLVHVPLDEHVCVEEHDTLGQSVSDRNTVRARRGAHVIFAQFEDSANVLSVGGSGAWDAKNRP